MDTNLHTHRTQVQWASGLNLLVGIWLFISAFVIYDRGPMVTNNIIFGIVVAVLAAIRLGGAYDQAWLSWLNAIAGIWVIVSPWAVMGTGPNGPSHGMIINNCITGAVVLVLACWSALATNTEPGGTTTYGTSPSYGR
jgi:hypothetical protein